MIARSAQAGAALVPLHRTSTWRCRRRPTETGVEDQRLDVPGQVYRAVDVRLDVAVEESLRRPTAESGVGQRDEREQVEVGRGRGAGLEDGVRVSRTWCGRGHAGGTAGARSRTGGAADAPCRWFSAPYAGGRAAGRRRTGPRTCVAPSATVAPGCAVRPPLLVPVSNWDRQTPSRASHSRTVAPSRRRSGWKFSVTRRERSSAPPDAAPVTCSVARAAHVLVSLLMDSMVPECRAARGARTAPRPGRRSPPAPTAASPSRCVCSRARSGGTGPG